MKDSCGNKSIEHILSRIKELSRIPFPSDQEIKEKEKLEDDVKLYYNEQPVFQETKINLGECQVIVPKKKKRTLFEVLYQKLKKKPITYEQIEKLKNERIVAYLKRDIAKAKYEAKNPGGKKTKKESGSVMPKLFPNDKENKSRPQDFLKMSGDNDPKKYKGLI